MRVRFKQDWTFAGNLEGYFVMIDYKQGQELRLKAAVYARAKSKGVVEDVEGRKPHKASAKDEVSSQRGKERDGQSNPTVS